MKHKRNQENRHNPFTVVTGVRIPVGTPSKQIIKLDRYPLLPRLAEDIKSQRNTTKAKPRKQNSRAGLVGNSWVSKTRKRSA